MEVDFCPEMHGNLVPYYNTEGIYFLQGLWGVLPCPGLIHALWCPLVVRFNSHRWLNEWIF